MPHDPLILALMVALLALQVSFKLLDVRNRKKSNGSAGQMSKDAWILIFNGLFDEKLKPFQEKHEHLVTRLDRMSEAFQANRQMIIDRLDKVAEATREESKVTRHDLRNVLQDVLNAVYRRGKD